MGRFSQVALKLDAEVRKAELAGAQLIRDDAKRRVPVAKGYLQEKIRTVRQPEGTYVVAGTRQVYWGRIVEHHPRHPRPFLEPAVEANREAVVGLVDAAIKRASA